MKLTEESLKRYVDLCRLESEEYFNFEELEGKKGPSYLISLLGLEREHERLKQQILANQEIVDIVKEWAQSEPITVSDGIKLTHEQLKIMHDTVYLLRNQIMGKTGMDIGEPS